MSIQRNNAVVVVVGLAAMMTLLTSVINLTRLHGKAPQPVGGTVLAVDPRSNPGGHAKQARMQEIDARFNQAVMMLHARRYDMALTALHRVLELSPRLPEAHLNMGYALYGLGNYKAALDFFNTAIELEPYTANPYYGLAEASAKMGDYGMAVGAMTSYLHLRKDAKQDDPFVTKGRQMLEAWRGQLPNRPEAAK